MLTSGIVHGPDVTLIPTLARRGKGTVKVTCYGDPSARQHAAGLAAKLAEAHRVGRGRVLWLQRADDAPEPGTGATRIQLREFGAHSPASDPGTVHVFGDLSTEVRESFTAFADKLSGEGFAFLHDQMRAGRVGPVLVRVTDSRVVGAIGPMETGPDSDGTTQLQPQYFGVLPDQRGYGHGRQLWRAAMHWGHTHEAAYQLLQTTVDGASDRLCQSEGLTSLGFACTRDAT